VEYPTLKTESDLRKCAISQQGHTTHVQAIVDGTSLQTSQMPRVQSPLFDFTSQKIIFLELLQAIPSQLRMDTMFF
jgi:hypothetical protein